MVVGAAAVVNIRRLHRFWQDKIRPMQGGSQQEMGQKEQIGREEQPEDAAIFSLLRAIWSLQWLLLA